MPARFPTLYRGGVHAQRLGYLPLRNPQHLTCRDQLFRDGLNWREGVVAEELENCGDATDHGSGFVAFPVADGCFVNADFVCNLLLEESEIQAALAEVVT